MTGRGRHFWRIALAGLTAWAMPLAAQTVTNSTQPSTTTPPPATESVGPRELQNFNLGGTVLRRAEPEAATVPAAKPKAAPPRNSTPAVTPPTADAQPVRKVAPKPVSTAPAAPPTSTAVPPTAVDLAPSLPEPSPVPVAAAPQITRPAGGSGWWPWWLAALAFAAGGGFLLWRGQQHQRPVTAGVGEMVEGQRPAPPPAAPRDVAPQPTAQPPRPAAPPRPAPVTPRPPSPTDGGIVSRGLKAEIAFEFTPLRAEIDAAGAAMLSFELTVINGGGAPARDVLVEALMVNAGPRQDEEITYFFRNPAGRGDRLPMVPPMGRVTLRMRVPLPAERLAPLEIEGRKLLVPLVAVNALYRSVAGEEQKSASFLVGRGGEDGGKMGPFSLDRGPRAWTGLSTRPHSAGLQA